jgi:PAS domain S-box-containing protein
MLRRIFQKIINAIAGKSEDFNLEHRFLNANLFITIIMGCFIALNNLLIYKNYALFLTSTVLSSSMCFWIYLSREKRFFKFPAYGLYFTMSIVLSYCWIVFSGINGPSLVFFSIFIAFFIFLFAGSDRIFVILFSAVNISILVLIELFYPKLIQYYSSNNNHLMDLNLGAVIFVFMLLFVINNFKRVYIVQQELLTKTAEELRKELFEKKKAEAQLAKFNENLESLLDIRTKKLLNELATRKKAEQGIIREHNLLRTIMESTPEAIVILDENGNFLDCNIKTLELIDYSSKAPLFGKSFFDFLKFNNHRDIAEQVFISLKEKKSKEIEYTYTNDKGEFVALTLLMGSVSVAEENNTYYILVAKDVTQWKLAEEELKTQSQQLTELNQSKDKFLSIIAHDIRNPLSAIIGFSDLLQNNYEQLSDEDRIGYTQNIRLSSESLLRLLQDLLEWSRSKTGKMNFEPEEINVSKIVNEVKVPLHYQAMNKQIVLLAEVKNDVYAIADKEMVKTILRNLISNAIKFTPKLGKIRVVSNEVKDNNNKEFVEISIIDNGVGIKEENLKKITMIDETIRTRGTDNETGTGLGLLLCRELIEKNNGYFYVKSIENSGSTFTFALPKRSNGLK